MTILLINLEKKIEFGQYRKTRPIQKYSADTTHIGRVCIGRVFQTEKLGQYNSYWQSFSVLAEFFNIGRVCFVYDADWFGHIYAILM